MIQKQQSDDPMIKFIKAFPHFENKKIVTSELSDGLIFAKVLLTVHNFHFCTDTLEKDCRLWTNKLSNLRKLVTEIEKHYEIQHDKGLKTRDIDLVEIARNNSLDEIDKLFELVLAVLMESVNKQQYIERIMSLDEKTQSSFVSIIKNGMESRITAVEEVRAARLLTKIQQYQAQNNFLRQQLQTSYINQAKLQKQVKDLHLQVHNYEDQIDKQSINNAIQSMRMEDLPIENSQLKRMVIHLRERLVAITIDHETEVTRLKEEILNLQTKQAHNHHMQQELRTYKLKFQDNLSKIKKSQVNDKDKNRLVKAIQEKDQIIKKLQQRIEQMVEKNYSMEENEIYMKVQLEKRDVRFKQLEKEVRGRLANNLNENPLPNSQKENLKNAIMEKQDYEEVKTQLQTSRIRARQLERENKNLSKKIERNTSWETEKKKLQKMLTDHIQSKNEEIQTLIVAMYQLREENIKMHRILTQTNFQC